MLVTRSPTPPYSNLTTHTSMSTNTTLFQIVITTRKLFWILSSIPIRPHIRPWISRVWYTHNNSNFLSSLIRYFYPNMHASFLNWHETLWYKRPLIHLLKNENHAHHTPSCKVYRLIQFIATFNVIKNEKLLRYRLTIFNNYFVIPSHPQL